MSLINFKKLGKMPPVEIKKECDNIPNFYLLQFSPQDIKRWDKILQKLKSNEILTDHELKLSLFNTNKFENNFFDLFIKELGRKPNHRLIEGACEKISRNLAPIGTLRALLNLNSSQENISTLLPMGINNNNIHFKESGTLEQLVDINLHSGLGAKSLIQSMALLQSNDQDFTLGQKHLVKLAYTSKQSGNLIRSDGFWIVEAIESLQMDSVEKLRAIDGCVAIFLQTEKDDWQPKLFQQGNALAEICQYSYSKYLGLVSKDLSIAAPAISTVMTAIRSLQNAISKLSEVAEDRGTYWKMKITESDAIKIKTFDNGAVGLAVTFGNYVIVEFGPIGNAAYTYEKNVFQSKILQRTDWKDKGETVHISGFNTKDGRLLHNERWENKFDSMIDRLKSIRTRKRNDQDV